MGRLFKLLIVYKKKVYSFSAENIGIPRPPNLGGRGINLLSLSEQFIPPVIAGANSVLMTSSNCLRNISVNV